ncbi:DUF2238 domain-containing protein [Stutzerimonas stutzeri]|uniref:DUF2238 domain-containing protein n=1 Tax=Stutzerimonas stutzeri TaxID=316 RepID=UPI00210B358C|nr:DUF2238 domain-containing protein [Stutzerimonas stutzeri]
MPVGFWLQDWLDLSRNPYDRLGHFFQGVVPALIARELLVRNERVHGRHLVPFVCVSMAMMLSAPSSTRPGAAARGASPRSPNACQRRHADRLRPAERRHAHITGREPRQHRTPLRRTVPSPPFIHLRHHLQAPVSPNHWSHSPQGAAQEKNVGSYRLRMACI